MEITGVGTVTNGAGVVTGVGATITGAGTVAGAAITGAGAAGGAAISGAGVGNDFSSFALGVTSTTFDALFNSLFSLAIMLFCDEHMVALFHEFMIAICNLTEYAPAPPSLVVLSPSACCQLAHSWGSLGSS